MLTSIWEEYGSGRRPVIVTICFLDGRLGFFKERERDADLKSASEIQIEEMICASNCLVRNACLVEEFAKFSVDAGIVALPKSANRIFVRSRGVCRATRRAGKLRNQRHLAIGAHRKPLAIFRFALGADHGLVEFTTRGCHLEWGTQRARRRRACSPGGTTARPSLAAGLGRRACVFFGPRAVYPVEWPRRRIGMPH